MPPDHGYGPGSRSRPLAAWVELAEQQIKAIMEADLAAPPVELQRRLEAGIGGAPGERPTTFHSHVVSLAIRNLESNNYLIRSPPANGSRSGE